jgi:hypothetical protein
MFIYSLKASTIKFFAVLCVALATLITLVAFVPVASGSEAVNAEKDYDYTGIKTNEDRIKFLGQFGWQVVSEPTDSVSVSIPDEFDKIFNAYNELQKRQGLDLSKYKGKNVQRYTYEITNYDGFDGKVYANILVYRNRVIAADVCSADIGGFVHGIERP